MAKTIKLVEGDMFTAKRVLIEVLSLPPQGCTIADMRKRMRVMDAIEAAAGGEVTLEDPTMSSSRPSITPISFASCTRTCWRSPIR